MEELGMLQSLNKDSHETSVLHGQSASSRRGGWLKFLAKGSLQAVLAFLVLFAAIQGMNKLVASKPEVARRPVEERSYPVNVHTAIAADYAPEIRVFGETRAAREVDLRALVGGEVIGVHPSLKAGGQVQAGDTLVSIDRFDYEGAITEAEANLAEARAGLVESRGRVELEKANLVRAGEQLEFAERDLKRAQDLLSRGAVTEKTFDDRKLIVSQRRQSLEQTQNTVALEEAKVSQQNAAIERLEWRLENARRQLEHTVLKAPFDAVVRTAGAELGRLVNVNDVVVSLYSSTALEVRFTLSDNQYGRLVAESGTVIGRDVEVRWYLGNEPLVYRGVVDRIGADVASSRGGVDLFATIETDAVGSPLRPGAFVEVSISDRTYHASYRLPETAVYGRGRVYVIDSDRLVARDVEPLAFDDGYVLVRGGLADGEAVLATRIPEAGEGLLVREIGTGSAQSDAGADAPSSSR